MSSLKADTKNFNDHHNSHIPGPNCKCTKKFNEHRITCGFYKEFARQFKLSHEEENRFNASNLDEYPMNKTIKVCCCSPEITHDETNKFIIVERSYEKDQPTLEMLRAH